MTPGLWIGALCGGVIFTALSWARLCHWANERPYSDGRQLPDIPEWVNDSECPDAVAVYEGQLVEVWL